MDTYADLAVHRRYTRAEAASMLNIPETWLKVWVTQGAVPHQRSGKPGPHQRGVWFTYADIRTIGQRLTSLVSTRQANSRAEVRPDSGSVNATGTSDSEIVLADSAETVAGVSDADLAAFASLTSLGRGQ
jgi:hypothetical protein